MKATQQHAKDFNAACLWVPLSPPSGGLTEAPQWEQGDSEYCLDCLGVSLFAGNTSLKFLTTLLHLCHIFATGACCIVGAQMEEAKSKICLSKRLLPKSFGERATRVPSF